MKIPIVDNIVMTSDANNIILNREVVVKGKTVLNAYAFYPTVVQALEGCLDEKIGESQARTIKGLVREHTALVGYFRKLLGTKLKGKQNGLD